MKLLLTGADGFTGRHFAGFAWQAGHEVVALRADLTDPEDLRQEILQVAPEWVVHLAGISFVGHANAIAFYDVNVVGTTNLLDALAALPNRPKRVLLASSANVYGNCQQSPIAESQLPAPVNHYGMSKLAMEFIAGTYLDRLPLFFVRPFNYTGPLQSESFVIPKLVSHFAKRMEAVELGNLEVEREFNDVRFVCEAYLRLLKDSKVGEVYNICTGKPVSLKSVIKLLRDMTGHDLHVRINKALIRTNEVHHLCGSNTKMLNRIGNIEQPSLQDTLRWMLEK